jgi:integrase
MRRFDPAGQPHAADTYVFGSEIGSRIPSVGRAWHTAVLKSHGQTPAYTETANLTPASRWLDGGVPLYTIRDWLGHTNIAQTSTYLAGTATTQHHAMRRFEAHQAALQQVATTAETGGKTRPRSAARRNKKPNTNAVGRGSAIM